MTSWLRRSGLESDPRIRSRTGVTTAIAAGARAWAANRYPRVAGEGLEVAALAA